MADDAKEKRIGKLIGCLPDHLREKHSEENLEQFAELFASIDVDASESISVKELKSCFKSLDITIKSEDLRSVFLNLGTSLDTDIEIQFPAFCGILTDLQNQQNARQRFRDNIHHILATTKESDCEKIRKKIWRITDEPSSSKLATAVAYTISTLIVLSTIAIVVEADPNLYAVLHKCEPPADGAKDCEVYWTFQAVEAFCVAVFTVEYGVRLATTPSYRKFIFSFFDTIDLLSILPFYVEITLRHFKMDVSVARALSVFRLARTLRILRISRHSVWMQVFSTAVAKSRVALATIMALFMLVVVICSSLMYNFETGGAKWDAERTLYIDPQTGGKSMFQNIPETFWWCIITMCLVGFGDEYPKTTLGHFLAILTAICGMVLLAIPVSVISANFKIQYDRVQRANMRKQDQKLLRSQIKHRIFDAGRGEKEQSMHELRKRFNETLENMFELNKTRLAYQFRRAQRDYRGELIRSVVEQKETLHRILDELKWQKLKSSDLHTQSAPAHQTDSGKV